MGVCMGLFVCMYVKERNGRSYVSMYRCMYVCKYGTYVRCTQAKCVRVVCVWCAVVREKMCKLKRPGLERCGVQAGQKSSPNQNSSSSRRVICKASIASWSRWNQTGK